MTHVDQSEHLWTIGCKTATVVLDDRSMAFTMQRDGGRSWRMIPDDTADVTVGAGDTTAQVTLGSAAHKEAKEYRTGDLHGVRVSLRGFRAGNTDVDATLAIIVAVDATNDEIVVRVIPESDESGALKEVRYPRPFDTDAVGEGVYHAIPSRQGFLLPNNWPHEVDWWWIGIAHTPAIYLPYWGGIRPGDAYLGILETPFDGGMHLEHPAGGPTIIGPKWHASMGTLRYPRQVRYTLFGHADHNDLIQRYREYVKAAGRLKTLETKATEVPRVAELEGTTIATTSTLYHTQPDSHYYNAEKPEANHRVNPFADCAAGLRRFAKKYGNDRVVVHLDGWGKRGYDNLHPDVLPPCEEAGGWDGFRAVGDVCDELGWLFATHDNYVDFYKDAETYNPDLAIHDADGSVPDKAWWAGGAQAYLCEQNALGYVKRNYEDILAHGVKLTSTYIDVFSIIELYECYHPDHREDRYESAMARARCFDWVRSKGIVLSSEEPTDWSIPYIDFCYWAPLQQREDLLVGEFVGTPVPLFNGVYHDCIVTPWSLTDTKDVSSEEHFLYSLAFGGCPMVGSPDRTTDFRPGELERARILAGVHRQTGFAPIDRHDIVRPDGMERVTEFGGGEKVHIDLRKRRFRLEGFKRMKKTWQEIPGA